MYTLPSSSRSRTLSSIIQSPEAASFNPLDITSKAQLSQRPTRRPFVQGTTHELVLEQPVHERAIQDDDDDPFLSFVSVVLRGKEHDKVVDSENEGTFSPASSTSSSSSSVFSPVNSFARFDGPRVRSMYGEPENGTPLTTPPSSGCPTRSNSDEGLSCSSPVDSAALKLHLAQLDLNARMAATSPANAIAEGAEGSAYRHGISSRPAPPSSSTRYPFSHHHPSSSSIRSSPATAAPTYANPSATPLSDLHRIRSVSMPQRSASEPDIHHQPQHLSIRTGAVGMNASHRRVSEASFSPASSIDSGSDRGADSPTTPTFSSSASLFLEEPPRAARKGSSSPNRRRVVLPKVDSSNLLAPSAPVLRPTNFWRHTTRSALNSPLAAPSANVHRRSSLINTGAAGSDECTQPDELLRGCEGKVYGDRIRVQELLI